MADIQISEKQAKSIVCILPSLHNLRSLELRNNGLSDAFVTLFIFAVFMSPTCESLIIDQNELDLVSTNTLRLFLQQWPNKLKKISIRNSQISEENLDRFSTALAKANGLKVLDLYNIKLSLTSCKLIGKALQQSCVLQELNVSACQISSKGANQILNGINKNSSVLSVDLSHNKLNHQNLLTAVRIAKVIADHPHLTHLKLLDTKLTRTEIILIVSSLQLSKRLASIHFGMQALEFYDRVLLRLFLNQRMMFNTLPEDQRVRHRSSFFDDKNSNQSPSMQDFNNVSYQYYRQEFNMVSGSISDLDLGIAEILRKVRLEDLFNENNNIQFESKFGNDRTKSHLDKLIESASRLDIFLARQRVEVEKFQEKIEFKDQAMIENFKEMGLISGDAWFDEPRLAQEKVLNTMFDNDWIVNQVQLKKIFQRVDKELLKQIKTKSSAELALLFYGINRVMIEVTASGIQVPMDDVVFSRVIKQPVIDGTLTWKDQPECRVCEKWSKQRLEFQDDDLHVMKQDIKRLDKLDEVSKLCLDPNNHKELITLYGSKISEFFNPIKNKKKKKIMPFMRKDGRGGMD